MSYRVMRIPQYVVTDDGIEKPCLYWNFYTTEVFANFIVSPQDQMYHVVMIFSEMNSSTTSNMTDGVYYTRIDNDTYGSGIEIIKSALGHVVISTNSDGTEVYRTTLKLVLQYSRRTGILNLNGAYSYLDYGEPDYAWHEQ